MFTDYFGFNENPFSIAPNPRYLYMSKMHQEALAHLVYGTTSKGCIVLLTGEIGTGKTTISRYFLEKLPRSTDIAVITNPKLTSNELLASVCDEFQISIKKEEPSSKDYIDSLNDFLLNAYSANRQAVLVIDEAQNLDLDVLEMLRLLTNLETNQQKLLKIILLGQSELASILARPDLEQINQRITSRYHLKGLKREDVDAYIAHRIMVAGGGRSTFFTRRAVNEIYSASRGIPRLINSLCDHALLGAYSENKERVDKKIAKKAAAEIFGTHFLSRTFRPHSRLILTAGILAILLFVGLWLGSTLLRDPSSEMSRQTQLQKISEQQQVPAGEKSPTADVIPQTEPLVVETEPVSQPENTANQPAESQTEMYTRQTTGTADLQSGERTKIVINPIEIND